jgi:hypothetical protein
MRHYLDRVLSIPEAPSGFALFELPVVMVTFILELTEIDQYSHGRDGYHGSAGEAAHIFNRYALRG